jgi:L-arabinose transport system substrate-binding protein
VLRKVRVKAANVIGIGINGVDAANEPSKHRRPGSLALCRQGICPDIHGYKTSEPLYNWVQKA